MNSILRIKRQFSKGRLLNTFSIFIVGRILAMLSSLLLLPLFTKKIPQEQFGIIGILWLASPILIRLINLGVDVAVSLKYFKLDKKELSNYLYNSLLIICFSAFCVWGLFYFNINWVHSILDPSMTKKLFSLFILSITGSILLSMMNLLLVYARKAWTNVLFMVLPPIVISGVTAYLIIYVEPSYTSYIKGLAIGNVIFGAITLIYFFRNYPIKYFKPSLKIIKNLLKVGIPILPGTIAVLILAAGDRYIIKYYMGLKAVAIYIYGYRFSEYILTSIFQPFQKSIVPIIMEKAAKNFKEATIYSQILAKKGSIYITIIVAFFIIPFKDVMLFLSDEAYDLSYTIFLISIFGILLNNIASVFSILFNHLERTDLNMYMAIICALLNVGLNIWLIPKYGIVAAAFTTVASFLIVLILSIGILNHFIHQKINVLKILIGTFPLLIYLIFIYYIDEYAISNQWVFTYFLKILNFIIFLIFTYFISEDLQKNIKKGILIFTKTNRNA